MVSAIITTYKREPEMVLRALDSVLAQTYKDMEIIVVDDSPSDYSARGNVRNAIEKRQHENTDMNIRYIAHEKNKGACVARNTGLSIANGEYIAYLDDDDEWLPDKIEKQVKIIQKSDVALVYCGQIIKDDNSGACREGKKKYVREDAFNELLLSNFIESTSYPLIRKRCLIEIGGFDPLMQSAQDYDVWLRLAERYEIDYVPEPLVLYHEHDGERITTNPEKKISGLERINQKNARYLEMDRKLWWKRNIGISYYYSLSKNNKKALFLWFQCVKKYPENIFENSKYFLWILINVKQMGKKDE